MLSAFLDALTVDRRRSSRSPTGFYAVYHRVASGSGLDDDHDHDDDELVDDPLRGDLERFRAFLRSLMMHAAVGTAMGGLRRSSANRRTSLIGELAGWDFVEFFVRMPPVTMPVLRRRGSRRALLERTALVRLRRPLPASVREVMRALGRARVGQRTPPQRARLIVQAITATCLVVGLALHVAEVGLDRLGVICSRRRSPASISEQRLGHAFEDALPFTALLVTFFAIVAVIHDQGLFAPVIDRVLADEGQAQLALHLRRDRSAVGDQRQRLRRDRVHHRGAAAFEAGEITREQFELLAIAINAGTNVPSIATPNGSGGIPLPADLGPRAADPRSAMAA